MKKELDAVDNSWYNNIVDAGIAQSVEQLIRNQQVVCSSHITSSIYIQDKKDVTNKSTVKSVLLSYFFANNHPFHHEKLDIQKAEYFFESSRQNRYHPVI